MRVLRCRLAYAQGGLNAFGCRIGEISPASSCAIPRGSPAHPRIGTRDAPRTTRHQPATDMASAATQADVMRLLRLFKADVALLTALADLGGGVAGDDRHRRLLRCRRRRRLTAVRLPVPHGGRSRRLAPLDAEARICLRLHRLAMGKHGAFELNYSSDIDLIVFYDARPCARRAPASNRRRLLRPPDARPRPPHAGAHRRRLRLPHRSAPAPRSRRHASRHLDRRRRMHYYETLGQNWERAALIKARAVAGDLDAGRRVPRRARALHLAQVSRLRRHRRHPRHEAPDPRLQGLRRHRASPATTSSSAAAASARSSSSRKPSSSSPAAASRPARAATRSALCEQLVERGWIKPAGRATISPTAYRFLRTHRAPPADDRRRADADAARRCRDELARLARFSGLCRTSQPSPTASSRVLEPCRATTRACSKTCRS